MYWNTQKGSVTMLDLNDFYAIKMTSSDSGYSGKGKNNHGSDGMR